MKLSIIIVNFNVKYFLEQALLSVKRAIDAAPFECETWVVDNASRDGSKILLAEKFDWVHTILNDENIGFAKANNQAIRKANGEFILLLNPDTVVQEDTFKECINFMNTDDQIGAIGIKMIDGKGNFLPESKRGLPTPLTSFFKISGLSSLFPRSKFFNKYHLGYLDENEIHDVEVLAGAFMLMRKSVLDEVGYLDEDFFMYGEDIDLSYRIKKAGYRVVYFPKTRIIHYKGESTKKGSLNYVKIFHKAMAIFSSKHFASGTSFWYNTTLQLAIFIKAIISFVNGLFKNTKLMWMDVILSIAGLLFIEHAWANIIKDNPDHFPIAFTVIILPGYLLVWWLSSYFSGAYDRPVKFGRSIRGIAIGTLLIAAVFAFLPNELRFSRMIILSGAIWTLLAMALNRFVYLGMKTGNWKLNEDQEKRTAVVGSNEEANRTINFMRSINPNLKIVGVINHPRDDSTETHPVLGSSEQIITLTNHHKIEEFIFCGKDISHSQIIEWITLIGPKFEYKIVPEESLSVIGSNSKNTAGDLYAIDVNLRISTPSAKRNKRLFDLISAVFLLISFPIWIFFFKKPFSFIRNCFSVLFGTKTWVGYTKSIGTNFYNLPPLKRAVIHFLIDQDHQNTSEEYVHQSNLKYARDYKVEMDLDAMITHFKKLDTV